MTRSTLSFAEACAQERVEVLTSVQRRPHWTTREKLRLVEPTYLPGQSVWPGDRARQRRTRRPRRQQL